MTTAVEGRRPFGLIFANLVCGVFPIDFVVNEACLLSAVIYIVQQKGITLGRDVERGGDCRRFLPEGLQSRRLLLRLCPLGPQVGK